MFDETIINNSGAKLMKHMLFLAAGGAGRTGEAATAAAAALGPQQHKQLQITQKQFVLIKMPKISFRFLYINSLRIPFGS